jgi:hypothetical protein
MNGPNKLECYITLGFARAKHSSLLGQFVIYKENEVLRIQPQQSIYFMPVAVQDLTE